MSCDHDYYPAGECSVCWKCGCRENGGDPCFVARSDSVSDTRHAGWSQYQGFLAGLMIGFAVGGIIMSLLR
jgi:hypothetical protein